jgi:hypothetical protein
VTVEASKKIRAALAAAGYRKTDVSVYSKRYSLGSTVYVTIKRAEIPLAAVALIAAAGENVRRDESGEILGGGNIFVETRYAEGVEIELTVRIHRIIAEHHARTGRQPSAARVHDALDRLAEEHGFTFDRITAREIIEQSV